MGDYPKINVDWQGANPVPIAFKPVSAPTIGHNSYEGFHPGRQDLLKKGHSIQSPSPNLPTPQSIRLQPLWCSEQASPEQQSYMSAYVWSQTLPHKP
jgi:hypothetical protein